MQFSLQSLALVIAGEETLNKAELIKILADRVIAIEVILLYFYFPFRQQQQNCFHSPNNLIYNSRSTRTRQRLICDLHRRAAEYAEAAQECNGDVKFK